MAKRKGAFSLQCPEDLLKKLEHDLGRLHANPLDQYAAFDFVVTAEHMLDWVYPDHPQSNWKRRAEERNNSKLLQITSHIASGAKHFIVTGPTSYLC
ncbi:MAG: hypothetical protein WKF37_05380 [Bryobacteraceae bacterium]